MLVVAPVLAACALGVSETGRTTETVTMRGHAQTLQVYGTRGGRPVIVSSGDGGWIHLGPHIASFLASQGYFVVGFDVRSYLSAFTSGERTLNVEDVPVDYATLLECAGRGSSSAPVLIGVSEGAGLSVLAAGDARLHSRAAGVIGIGLPAVNELGWHWRDALIYVTHRVPNEPTFATAPVIGHVAPLPLALIRSTHDEFVSETDEHAVLVQAREPKRTWTIDAADHRFSDNLGEFDRRLLEALAWIRDGR